MRYSTLSLLAMLLTLACFYPQATGLAASKSTDTSSDEHKLENTQWTLASFGAVAAPAPVIEGATISLKFGTDNQATGTGGCNSYGGEYRAQGESLSFNKLISTRRACADENRMRQEQRYFTALTSARRFTLAGDHLTIFYDNGRSALNFAQASPPASANPDYENRDSPVALLASYFNAVNRKEYARAYRYWGTPPGNLAEFARGYADTESVQLIVEPPTVIEGAAGSLYVEIPAVIVAQHRDSRQQTFAGCYTLRKSNLHPPDIPKEDVWHIYQASVKPVANNAAIPQLLIHACQH